MTALHHPPLAADPVRERARLQEILDLDLFAPEVSLLLQDLVEAASTTLRVPIGLVNLILDEAQYVAAQYGLSGWIAQVGGTPIEWAICRYTVHDGRDFIVVDASLDARTRALPTVRIDGLRCYAGIPLITTRGHAVGSFCVAGPEARTFSDTDLSCLRRLAAEAVRRIEARRSPVH